ncbi:hypothetical protein C6A77_23955 [Pseudomonas sp. AFG_SD02_1510_Pfu_092]|nr:hypothetical protein C6A77_23955 [Pseudomonas sp. AFG_SD02_1510_Pfu_092]
MSPQFLYCSGAFWAPTVPSTCSITSRGRAVHAHPPARAYRLRDRLRNKGQWLAAPWPKSKVLGRAQKLLLMNARPGLPHSCPNKALKGLASVASAGAVWLLKSPEAHRQESLDLAG